MSERIEAIREAYERLYKADWATLDVEHSLNQALIDKAIAISKSEPIDPSHIEVLRQLVIRRRAIREASFAYATQLLEAFTVDALVDRGLISRDGS